MNRPCPVFFLLRVVLASAALALPCAAVSNFGPAFLWRVSDGDSEILLLGSIHLLPTDQAALRRVYEIAADVTDEVYFEADIEDTAAVESAVNARAYYTGSRSLANDFSPTSISRLRMFLQAHGYAYNAKVRPWVYLTLVQSLVADNSADYDETLGVDAQLLTAVRARGSQAVGFLETPDFQVQILAATPVNQIEDEINELITSGPTGADELAQLIGLWLASDLEGIDTLLGAFDDGGLSSPYSIETRNGNWMPALETHLAQNRHTLFVVGTAHMLGPNGLLQRLTRAGYSLTRLPEPPVADLQVAANWGTAFELRIDGTFGYTCLVEMKRLDPEGFGWTEIDAFALTGAPERTVFADAHIQPYMGAYLLRARIVDR